MIPAMNSTKAANASHASSCLLSIGVPFARFGGSRRGRLGVEIIGQFDLTDGGTAMRRSLGDDLGPTVSRAHGFRDRRAGQVLPPDADRTDSDEEGEHRDPRRDEETPCETHG